MAGFPRSALRLFGVLSAVALIAAGLSGFVSTGRAGATSTTLYVDGTNGTATTGCSSAGTGACKTIQEGVNAAELYVSSDVTVVVAAGIYDENDTLDVPSGDTLTLQGAGAASTTVDGGGNGAVITVSSGIATMSGFTITGGSAANGAGVDDEGTVALTDDTITDNSASGCGGGVMGGGTVTLTDDMITNNSAGVCGGGVSLSGSTATLEGDTISGNTAVNGGGVDVAATVVSLTHDTLSNDMAHYGGGVNNNGTITLVNDTLADDSASSSGGGVNNLVTAALVDDTLAGDSASSGGGVENGSGSTTVSNSILSGAECSGTITDGGYNVEDDDSCGFGATDVVNSSTINLASSLAVNGSSGPETLAIGTNSSAFEEVPPADCTVTTDERGDARPGVSGQNCDAGAFEYQIAPSVTSVSPSSGPQAGGTSVTVTGTNFTGSSAVNFGSTAGTGLTVNSSTSITITSPAGGGTVDVTVTTPGGTSATSSDDHFSYTATVPGAPTIGTAAAGNASASVTFVAPSSNGGATITSYTVTSSPGAVTGSRSSSPITVSGLTNGTSYTFTVTATNSAGTSAASSASNAVIPTAPVSVTPTPINSTPSKKPKVVITSKSVILMGLSSRTPSVLVRLSCETEACSGSIHLNDTVITVTRIKVKVGKKTVTKMVSKKTTVVLASASYKLAKGRGASVGLALTPSGHSVLSTATAKKPLVETVVATVERGRTATKSVTVS